MNAAARPITAVLLLAIAAAPARAQQLATDDQKTLYALGASMAQSLGTFRLTPQELAIVRRGLEDHVLGRKPQIDVEKYQPRVLELAKARAAAALAAGEKELQASLAKEKNATRFPSGLVVLLERQGTGARPGATDTVRVHYTGRLADGRIFDSSVQRGQPAEFRLGGVIPCWTEGIQQLRAGGKARLVCPPSIAYGAQGHPPVIPPGATLVFEVELLDVAGR